MNRERTTTFREGVIVPLLVLTAATLGFFWRILFTPDAWKPAGGGDLVSYLFPSYRFAAQSLRAGHIPLWNPHLYGGAPFLGDMQTGLFYPLNLVLFLFFPAFPYKAMEVMAILHIFLAGLFMYLCLRYMEPKRPLLVPAALAGAIIYMFSDIYVVHFGNLNLIGVAAWLPLIILLFWRALRRRSLLLAAGAGLALGVSTLEGHLQITLIIGTGLVLAAVAEVVSARRSWRGWAWSLLALAVTAAVAIGLAAIVLLPTLEFTRHSPRALLPYKDAVRYSLVPGLLGEMLVPALFSSREPGLYWGVWDRVAVGYVGIFALLLAGLAVLLRRGSRVCLFVCLAVVALLLALGGESIVHGWVYRLAPGFGQLRAPARFVLLLDFALAGLAALGLDRLLRPMESRTRRAFEGAWRLLLWGGIAVAIVALAWAYLVIFQAQDRDPTLFWRVSAAGSGVVFALVMLAASLAWLAARRSGRIGRRALAWLAVGLVFIDLATIGAYTDIGKKSPASGYDHPQVVGFLKNEPGFFRIDSRTGIADVWQPNLAQLAGLFDVNGVDNPLVLADMTRYWDGTGGRSTPLYDLLGVRYVLAGKEVTLDWAKFTLAFDRDPALNVYLNESALPRAFVVHQAVVASGHEDAWALIHGAEFDPTSSVVLEGGQALDVQSPAGMAQVEVLSYEPDRAEIAIESPAEGYLVLSDPFYPGWRATLDGEEVPLLRADYAFRAVRVPAGTHRVVTSYEPATGLAGSVITAITLIVLLGLALWAAVRKRRWRPGTD